MAKTRIRKIALEIDARLYADLSRLAKENGQRLQSLLEKALEHYLRSVMPSQNAVRPEVTAHSRKSTEKNKKLLALLSQ
jgi:hypothetical protein